ncbi:MAG: hypothetical protein J6X33_00120 [Clostridiales bacterium]|nr:hypothetical protein [Clostridiales bacterium]
MEQKKHKWYAVILAVLLAILAVLTALTLAYAYAGTYKHNQPSNIWSIIWDKGYIGLWLILTNFVALNAGIAGLITQKKGVKAQLVLSIILLALHIPAGFSMILAIGAHY